MADFSNDIDVMEKLAKSVAEKERGVTDVQEMSEIAQVKAHLHNAYLILNRISRKD